MFQKDDKILIIAATLTMKLWLQWPYFKIN